MNTRAERRRIRRKQCFHQFEIEYFIREEYPSCPEFAVVYFANYICSTPKNWRNASIAEAVYQTMQNELRHQQTDYEQLMLVGVRRKQARQRVQPRIDKVIALWKKELAGEPGFEPRLTESESPTLL